MPTIRSLEKCLGILEPVATHPENVGVRAMAKRLKINPIRPKWVLVVVGVIALSVVLAAPRLFGESGDSGFVHFKHFQQRITQKARSHHEPAVMIIAFGDSVTQGFTRPGMIEPQAVYHARLKRLLEHQYSKTTFSVFNAGYGGRTASSARVLLERDVIDRGPDMVIIGFGLNDCLAGLDGIERFTEAMKEHIHRIRQHSAADVILLTPNFLCTGPNANAPASLKELAERFGRLQTEGVVAAYAEAIRKIGAEFHVPVADVYAAWEGLANEGVDTNVMLANGLNHPTGETHALTAELLMQTIFPTYPVAATADLRSRYIDQPEEQSKRDRP